MKTPGFVTSQNSNLLGKYETEKNDLQVKNENYENGGGESITYRKGGFDGNMGPFITKNGEVLSHYPTLLTLLYNEKRGVTRNARNNQVSTSGR